MVRGAWRIAIAAVWLWGSLVLAAEPEGDLYQLGIALNQEGVRGSWKAIGEPGQWMNVRAGAILNGRLYTAETDGTLRITRLDNGKRTAIGRPEFGTTELMFASGESLWTIETGGNLYRVNPHNAAWWQIGAAGGWNEVRAGAILHGVLYTVEHSGALYATDLSNGTWKQVGTASLGDVKHLFAAGEALGVIDAEGNLWHIDPRNGGQCQVRPPHGWKSAIAVTAVNGRVYSAEHDGRLQEANPADGKRTPLGGPDFANTKFMLAGNPQLYTIENDGTLYVIHLHPPQSVDGWDCFPREFEKVFREQANGFYRNMYPRQILGSRATHAEILGGIGWLKSAAQKQDMVVIYLTCHGGTDPIEGWGVGTADGQTLWGRELKQQLAQLPCHALVFIETCGSGGFAHPHPHDPPVPANVTAVCACSGQQKASNELDIAALEALWGRADFSRDGVVELDEMLEYIERRYRKMFPAAGQNKVDVNRSVMVKARTVPGSLKLTKVSPQLGAIVHDGQLFAALVTGQQSNRFNVHVIGFNNQPGEYFITSAARRDSVCLPSEGAPMEVEQNGTWYPARIVQRIGGQYRVHYLGYNEEEIVTPNRMRNAFLARPIENKPNAN
jgi:hypothetical protein